MSLFGIGEGLSNLLTFENLNGPLSYAVDTGYGIWNNERNYKLQHKLYDYQLSQFQYQKQLQQELFNREDNAVQRRMKDLKAAGMNPLLAAGGAASAGQAVSVTTPSSAPQHGNLDLLARAKQAQDISMTKTQQELLNSQKVLTNAQADISRKTAALQQMTIDWYKDHPGYAPNVDTTKTFSGGIFGLAERVGGRIGSVIGSSVGSHSTPPVSFNNAFKFYKSQGMSDKEATAAAGRAVERGKQRR